VSASRSPIPAAGQLDALLHTSPLAIVALDLDGAIARWNPAAERLFGWSEGEVRGRPLPFLAAAPGAEARAWQAPLLRGEFVSGVDLRGQRRDGTLIDLGLSGAPVRDAAGRVAGLVIFLTDTGARRREVLDAQADHARLLAEGLADVIWVFDRQLRPVYISPSVTRLRGYTVEEVMAQPLEERFTPASLAHLRSVVLVELALEQSGRGDPARTRTLELELPHKDGSTVWVEMKVTSLRDPEGRLTGFAGVSRDITARRQAEQQLHLQAAALEAAANAIVITNRDGVVEWVNPAFTALTGYPVDEIVGKTPRVLKSGRHDEAFYRELWQTILSGKVWEGEVVNCRRDGSLYTESETITPVRGTDGRITHFIAIKQDVTAQKDAAVQLERQREALYQREKLAAMGQLLAGVAHELNNPLAVLVGQAFILHDRVQGGPLAKRVQQIGDAAERCARIVKNFLALARQYPPERHQVSLNAVVQEAVELLAYALRVDSVKVELDLVPTLPVIWADRHQLQQVLLNLISNAHQAMREVPSYQRRLILRTRPLPDGRGVALSVRDTGPGIPLDAQRRVFEPFFTTKPPGHGTGLGLSLCRGIVEGHRGTMGVESEPGQGARLWVELPIGTPPDSAAAPTREAVSTVTRQRILIVDDEAEVATLLAEILVGDGHEVERAPNGLVALDKAREHAYDLIFCDVRMPELDGPGVYRELARRQPDSFPGFVFVTGDVLSEAAMVLMRETGAPMLSKPFTVEDVRAVVARVIR
jgi:two-component system NtrC family sensor kinase